MPKYSASTGEKLDKKAIDRKVKEAKAAYLQSFFDQHDYHFCERSGRSDLPLDCSHIISVRMAQASGKTELAYCKDNIEMLCRDEHMKIEKWSNAKRERWYYARKRKIEFKDFEFGENINTFFSESTFISIIINHLKTYDIGI